MNRFETLLQQCDADIRAGHPHEAARRLAKLDLAHVPREWRLPLAKICRRTGLLSLGLRLLVKLINGRHSHHDQEASPAERAEYAVLLLRSGAVNESLQRLQSIDTEQVPDALLFRAYAHFALWEYEQAIPHLKKYQEATLTPHSRLVGKTNLAFAMAECRQHEQALRVVEENIEMARDQGLINLESFNYGIRAQIHLQDQNWPLAHRALHLALPQSSAAHNHDQFYPTKLKLIVEGLESRSLRPFAELRELALRRRDWFALREADLFSLKVQFQLQKFLHLYFGSPLTGFRDCIRRELNYDTDRSHYVLGEKSAPRFDLVNGTLNGQKVENPGGKCHQMMGVFLEDFYEPLRIASLHAALYPDEHFNILSSPDRVRQIIRRTRRWLEEAKYPVTIREDKGFYSLEIQEGFSFLIPLHRHRADLHQMQMRELEKIYGYKDVFSRKEVCETLQLSQTSAHRFLRQGIEAGKIIRLGPTKRPEGYRLKEATDLVSKKAA